MTTPSNLYAEKVYAEHPIALWSLDDSLDYLQFLSESNRLIDEPAWTITGVDNYYTTSYIEGVPFPNSYISTIEGTPNALVVLKSPSLGSLDDFHNSLGTFCTSLYYYSNSTNYDYIEIGYEYVDSDTLLTITNVNRFTTITQDVWSFLSHTFAVPEDPATFKFVIKIQLNDNGSTPDDYVFYFNGLSVGQWSEEFNATSLGVESINLPSSVALQELGLKAIESDAYGSNIDKGYYVISNNILTAKNTSIPLVYGSAGVIKLIPNSSTTVINVLDGGLPSTVTFSGTVDGGIVPELQEDFFDSGLVAITPSYIIPGKGFLNNSGKYKKYTLEFWARIESNTKEPHRIVGPIASNDGIYVEKGFVTVVIGNKFASHFVGEWIRPMLFNLILNEQNASLLINGEQVLSLDIDYSSLSLPNKLNDDEKDQDYIGFFAFNDVESFEIDSVAIYPYAVTDIIAKRRFVYGQGVGSSERIDNYYAGVTAAIDYPEAEYTSDYNYPDFARWDQAIFDNVITDGISLQTPDYLLPDIFISGASLDSLYNDINDLQTAETKFFTFNPNSSWNSINSYIHFNRLDNLTSVVKMINAVFSVAENSVGEQTLIKIYNDFNNNYLKIIQDGLDIKYLFNFNNNEIELYSFETTINSQFALGFDIDAMSAEYENLSSFFNNLSLLKMYVGGDNSGTKKFTGKIFSLGFSTIDNKKQFEDYIEVDGIINYQEHDQFLNNLSSYTLLPTVKYNSFFLDIGVSGYWQDYVPLSYFATYVTNSIGGKYYDLDFLQFNVDYPSPSKTIESETTSEWQYSELDDSFTHPVIKPYASIDSQPLTGWIDYYDMTQNADKYYKYDMSDEDVRTYITMQYIADGVNNLQSTFTTTTQIDENKVVDLSDHSQWLTHKFEVVDGSIIYPPSGTDFNELAIVYRLEFNTRGILNKKIKVKKLQIASQAFDNNKFSKIGTKFGYSLIPYVRSGLYYDYKTKNPFTIYKNSTPHLYMTSNSGIELKENYQSGIDKGLYFTINQGQSDNYKVSALQFWIRSNNTFFPGTRKKFAEINYNGDSIEFYIVANSNLGNRGRLIAIKKSTGQPFTDLKYYVNGNYVREPVISRREWAVIGISFTQNLDFDNFLGSLNLTGPYLFNFVSYYQATNLQLAQSRILRSWSEVEEEDSVIRNWTFWDENYTWNQVLVIGTSDLYGTNPSDIYKTYIGTNKIIIDDDNGVVITPDKLKIYQEPSWQSFVVTPV